MLSERRKRVLESIISEFIKSAEPVGSKALIEKYDIPYSSATVRNEMMQLEEMGLLEKPHTSSGRIPSEAGYKFYIQSLMNMQQFANTPITNADDKDDDIRLLEKLVAVCHNSSISFDERIKVMIKLLSEVMSYTVFYIEPSLDRTIVSSIRLVQVSEREALLVLMTDVGKIETRMLPVTSLQEYDTLGNIVKYMDERLSGTSLARLSELLESDLKPLLMQQVSEFEHFYNEINAFFQSFSGSDIYFAGQSKMITDDNLLDFDNLKKLFDFFEDDESMQWFRGSIPGLSIHIGEDIHHELFKELAVIRMTFDMPTQGYGTIGVIGPKRMQYNDVIQMLTFVGQFINKGGY